MKKTYSVLKLSLRDILRVNSALNTLQHNLDLLIGSVINAHTRVLQPQVISPVTLTEALIKSVSIFRRDTSRPFPLSKDSAQLLLRLYDLQVLRPSTTTYKQRQF